MTIKEANLDGNTLPIREFKLEWMAPNPSICMIAKRASGKSWLVRTLLRYFSSLPCGIIISKTDKMSTFYGKFIPEVYIYYEYKSEIIETLLDRQRKIIEKCKQKKAEGKKVDPRTFVVMDDCLSSKGTWMREKEIMELFFNGRHYKIMYILTMQFPLGVTPELRGNFDYIFLLADDFISNQKRIYQHYAGMFPNEDAFRQVFLQLTSNYGAMVIVNRGAKTSFLDKVFWYGGSDKEIKSIGNRQYNSYNKDNYDVNWEKKKRFIDTNQYFAERKKTGNIKVFKKEANQEKSSEKYSDKSKSKDPRSDKSRDKDHR